eukprot:m.7324 g.7324  ORF g.7324 m.7324 type:complete len:238 (-) comp5234_c0_seq2:1128-1841(-)
MASLWKRSLTEFMRRFKPQKHTRDVSRVLYTLNDRQTLSDQWLHASDKDIVGGHSTAKLEVVDNEFARFSGYLSTELTGSDKSLTRSGFCLMRTRKQLPTLLGASYIDMQMHNGLEFVLRGDGRAYIATIQTSSLRDEDLFQAAIYTRGGHHWQTVQVPFADFLLTHRGYLQSEQQLLNSEKIATIGILLADRRDGPFQLDVKQIRSVAIPDEVTQMDTGNANPQTVVHAKAEPQTE